ncbi:hypothetical protein RA2_03917 [Roseovarius sp. A-2]|nr:hypothetical protein RA2_03917 [Roseovarius sp. A-2]
MGSIGDWNWAIAVASARYNALIVEDIFSKWPNDQPHPPVHEIIFCATNLAFATELFLKAACVACSGKVPPGGHKLRTIFMNIPKHDRQKIIAKYDKIFASKYCDLRNGEIWFRLNDSDLPAEKRPTSLLEVLDHYSTSYEDWRYIFAIRNDANPSNLRGLHYSRLMCLCEATDQHLQNRFPEIVRRNEVTILS